MAFKTGKLLVGKEHVTVFNCVEDVPGYAELAEQGLVSVINFMHNNIENTDLCLQAAETKHASPMLYDSNAQLIAANGWRVKQILGQGKDGITVLGCKYSDQTQEIKTVKLLSKYGRDYLNHTELFNEIFKRVDNKSKNFFKLTVGTDYTYYNNSLPLNPIDVKNFNWVLSELCNMNHWAIKNTGFVLWDFGFGSGRNYMMSNNGVLNWIDYGGAGMLRCPNFEYIYTKYSDLPNIELQEPAADKQSLIIADSNFIKCQFLLHIEYWLSNRTSNADIWSSMLQIRRNMIDEIHSVLYNTLQSDLTKSIYVDFVDHDWTDEITWKQLRKYIDANT
jgi:hypothetical protein